MATTSARVLKLFLFGIAFAPIVASQAQDLCSVCCYVTGYSLDLSPYVEVSVNGQRMETLGPQEYHCMLVSQASGRLTARRDGFSPKILTLGREEVQVYKVVLADARWSMQKDPSPPPRLLQQGKSLLTRSSETASGSQITGVAPLNKPIRVEWMLAEGCPDMRMQRYRMEIRKSLSDHFTIVNRDVMGTLLDEQKLSLSGLATDSSSVSAGELVPALYSVIIDLTCSGRTSIQFVNSSTSIVECSIALEEPINMVNQKLREFLE